VTGLAFILGGHRLISVGEDQTLRIWKKHGKWRCARTRSVDTPLYSLAIDSRGSRAASAGAGGKLLAWRLQGG
jgi:hypothetical protein